MTLRALVPDPLRSLFEARSDTGVLPTFYRYVSPTYGRRLMTRVGRAEGPRLRLPDDDALSDVSALWLGAEVEISARETEDLLSRLPSLRWVYCERAGIDHLHADPFRQRRIPVSNAGDLTSLWVAEMHLALVLSHAKSLPMHFALGRGDPTRAVPGRAVAGLRVLVLGTGNIGRATAKLCVGCGMSVVGVSRQPSKRPEASACFDRLVDFTHGLEEELRTSDVLIVAVPLTNETRGLIDGGVLSRMKPDAALVNLARPRIVHERALVHALRSKSISAAFVSRLEDLPLLERLRCRFLDNLHLTHNSEANVEGRRRAALQQFVRLAAQAPHAVENRVI